MTHKFNVMEIKYKENGDKTVTTKAEFNTPGEAMDFVREIKEPLANNRTWELVAEGGFDDGVNANKMEQIFEYENTHNGDIREYKYYIEHETIY